MEKILAENMRCFVCRGASPIKLQDEINRFLLANPKIVIYNIDYQVVSAGGYSSANEYSVLITYTPT